METRLDELLNQDEQWQPRHGEPIKIEKMTQTHAYHAIWVLRQSSGRNLEDLENTPLVKALRKRCQGNSKT